MTSFAFILGVIAKGAFQQSRGQPRSSAPLWKQESGGGEGKRNAMRTSAGGGWAFARNRVALA
jgi:hypothetical protein